MKINLQERERYSEKSLDNHIYNIRTRGYSIFEDFLTLEECSVLKKIMMYEIDHYKYQDSSDRAQLDSYQIHDLVNNINFGGLFEDPRLQQLLAPLLSEYWIMYAATSSSIPPNGENYASRLHVDCPRYQPGYIFNVGVIWALDDYTNENGGLKILPGSQHSEQAPELDFFEENSVQLTCKAGSLIVFNAKTYHRTCKNNTESWSHSMTLNACRPFMKQRLDWVRFIPDSISSKLNTQARRIIGFDTRLPSSLEEFFVSNKDRLYKPNQG